jgi:hypothetical protein
LFLISTSRFSKLVSISTRNVPFDSENNDVLAGHSECAEEIIGRKKILIFKSNNINIFL